LSHHFSAAFGLIGGTGDAGGGGASGGGAETAVGRPAGPPIDFFADVRVF
jgi:hypothetical protein